MDSIILWNDYVCRNWMNFERQNGHPRDRIIGGMGIGSHDFHIKCPEILPEDLWAMLESVLTDPLRRRGERRGNKKYFEPFAALISQTTAEILKLPGTDMFSFSASIPIAERLTMSEELEGDEEGWAAAVILEGTEITPYCYTLS